MIWIHLVPPKCIRFVWRPCMGRIPSIMVLSSRCINISSTTCQLCSNGVDESDHLLVECSFAIDTFSWVFNWCGIFSTVFEFVNFVTTWDNCQKNGEFFSSSFMASVGTFGKRETTYGLTRFIRPLLGRSIWVISKIINKFIGVATF